MALTSIQSSLVSGEISPLLYGRVDLAKWHEGASTMRNFFVNYRGGASSRAGFAYVGMCKQGAPNAGGTSTSNPPRDLTFQFSLTQGYALEFGDQYMRIKSNGAYVIEATKAVSGATQANPCVLNIPSHGFSVGDWVYFAGLGGMTEFNGLTWVVNTVPDADHITLTDLFGTVVNSTNFPAYTSGGTAARIYTLTTPYAAADLPYLKYTQSADTMTLCCVNTATQTDYAPYELKRQGATNWTLTAITFASSISAPTGVTATAHSSTTVSTYYSYVVTAVNSTTGEESVASAVATVENNDIAVNAGSNVVTWTGVTGADSYNIYKATPSYSVTTPSGVLFGYAGTSSGTSFTDTNITADFTRVPPVHQNPFGSAGNYPGTVAYYQQRRVYASTLNNPDTYYMSQPGAYANMDSSVPASGSDAITGTPWAQQVNGVQFLVPMPGGLVVLTGRGAWQLNGGSSAAITPSTQDATPQAYNGCNGTVPPLTINYDILYVQSKGSIVRDLSYNFFVNIYTGTDMTVLSNHLFADRTIIQWAWAEEPYKIVWVVMSDGTLLSFTYLKEQDVYAWSRHDTDGLFIGVTSVTEPPVDAIYAIVQRYIKGKWVYYSERMDNRNWQDVESVFCVDSGLTYPRSYPAATLSAASSTGSANISAVNLIQGGQNFTAPTITALDPTGAGSGATFSATVSGGVITGVTVLTQGQNYAVGTQLIVNDATGSGAILQPIITNNVTFTASTGVFANSAGSGAVGDVIRIGGGKATVTSYVSSTQVVANITQPITAVLQNDGTNTPVPSASGTWSIATPTKAVSGLNHLEGKTVSILADGSVMPQQTVTNGAVTLPQAYSAITVGLPFTAQLQTLYLDPPGQPTTTQSRRKKIVSAGVRVAASRGFKVGTDQPDAATQPDNATPAWSNLVEVKERGATVNAGTAIPLFTGDHFINLPGNWDTKGQIAIEQDYPLPCNVLAIVSYYEMGDSPG